MFSNANTAISYRRFIYFFSVLFCVLSFSLSAAETDGRINYFSDMADDTYYAALLEHVFDGGDIEEACRLYDELAEYLPESGYDPWMQDAALGRASLILGRYSTQVKPKRKDLAEEFLSAGDALIASSRENGAPDSAAGVLEALSMSFWYLVDGSLSKGLKFPKMADALYEEYPEDFHVLLLEAEKYLNSPGIVGGNKKTGLALFQQAEKMMEKNGCAIWDAYTIYCGLAKGYDSQKQREKAAAYAELAYDIYTSGDDAITKILGR